MKTFPKFGVYFAPCHTIPRYTTNLSSFRYAFTQDSCQVLGLLYLRSTQGSSRERERSDRGIASGNENASNI